MKMKLENFKKENYITSNAFNKTKNEYMKSYGNNFDETIKHLANVIVDQVSNNYSMNQTTKKVYK